MPVGILKKEFKNYYPIFNLLKYINKKNYIIGGDFNRDIITEYTYLTKTFYPFFNRDNLPIQTKYKQITNFNPIHKAYHKCNLDPKTTEKEFCKKVDFILSSFKINNIVGDNIDFKIKKFYYENKDKKKIYHNSDHAKLSYTLKI